MSDTISIDRLGRVVIPKAIRDRLRLAPGTPLQISQEEGRIVLTPDVVAPTIVERDGFLVLDLGTEGELAADHRAMRDARAEALVRYALLR